MATSRKNTIITVSLIVAAFFLYYVLFMRRAFVRNDIRFPYFWSKELNRTLRRYVETLPSRQVLFVTGTYQSGKSRALDIISKELRDRLVIKLTGSNPLSLEVFADQLKHSILRGLINICPLMTADQIKTLNLPIDKRRPSKLSNEIHPIAAQINKQFTKILNTLVLDNNIVNSSAVWSFFALLNQYHDILRPVIIIQNSDGIFADKTSGIFEITEHVLRAKNQYNDFLPIVLEIHNSMIVKRFNKFSGQNILRFVETSELNETATEILIRNHVFSSSELKRVISVFGKHGGAMSHIYEDLKYGSSINEAIEKELHDTEDLVNNAVNFAGQRNEIPRLLCKSNGVISYPNKTKLVPFQQMFEKGLLYVDNELKIHVANKGILKSICNR